MIRATATAFAFAPPAQEAAQAHSHPLVEPPPRRWMTMFEVLVLTPQDWLELRQDDAQALSIRAFGQLVD